MKDAFEVCLCNWNERCQNRATQAEWGKRMVKLQIWQRRVWRQHESTAAAKNMKLLSRTGPQPAGLVTACSCCYCSQAARTMVVPAVSLGSCYREWGGMW